MKKKERTVGIVMAVIMSAAMGLIAAFLVRRGMNPQELASSPPAPVMYLSNALESIAFGILFTLILPMGKWGRELASKAGAVPPSFKFHLLNSLPVSVACAILVSLPVSLHIVFLNKSLNRSRKASAVYSGYFVVT